MEVRNITVVVEDVDVARTALTWALHNIIRYGDTITLLHIYPLITTTSKTKARCLRLKGFHLALSFQHICNTYFSNTNVEIIVTEEDREGMKIVATVREIGASMLILGLHHHSFLYKLAMDNNSIASYFNCKVLAIKQPPVLSSQSPTQFNRHGFSQIHFFRLPVPHTPPPPKVKYRICPDPAAICWRLRRSRRR